MGYVILLVYVVIAVFAFRPIIRRFANDASYLEGWDVSLAAFCAFYWPVGWPMTFAMVPGAYKHDRDRFARLKRWAGVK